MAVDVVIVNWGGGPELVRAVESTIRFGGRPIVVDNASPGGSIDEVAARPGVTVVRHARNLGFAAGCNSGAAAGTGEVILLLNPDAEIINATAADLEAQLADSEAILLGLPLVSTAGEPIDSTFPLPGAWPLVQDLLRVRSLRAGAGRTRVRSSASGERAGAWVTGAALALRRADWNRLRGLDEGYFLWYEDIDLGARVAAAGGGVGLASGLLVRHAGASSWQRLTRRRRQWLRVRGAMRYARRHLGPRAVAALVAAAPAALAIGIALDVMYRVRRGQASAGHTSRPGAPDG